VFALVVGVLAGDDALPATASPHFSSWTVTQKVNEMGTMPN
jgi:hypothetical protein